MRVQRGQTGIYPGANFYNVFACQTCNTHGEGFDTIVTDHQIRVAGAATVHFGHINDIDDLTLGPYGQPGDF